MCHNALDGVTTTNWATMNQGVGAWINVVFVGTFTLTQAKLMQKEHSGEKFKDVMLTYGTSSLTVTVSINKYLPKCHENIV